MTVGLPKTLTKIYRKTPVSATLERKLFKAYAKYLRLYVKARTWYNYDRKNSANLYPLKLIWINPQEIEYGVNRPELKDVKGTLLPQILDGSWDEELIFNEDERKRYRSMKQHFEDGLEWTETEHYKWKKEILNQNGKVDYGGDIQTEEELEQVYDRIDELYQEIKKNGYKTQREIRKKEKIINAQIRPDHYTNELNEVIVDIGRNGEILFHENRHRFYISKILGLEKIPVRVLIRHKKWQEKRNIAIENPKALSKEKTDHPDIEYLID